MIDDDIDMMQDIIEGRCLDCGSTEESLNANFAAQYAVVLYRTISRAINPETHLCYRCESRRWGQGIDNV